MPYYKLIQGFPKTTNFIWKSGVPGRQAAVGWGNLGGVLMGDNGKPIDIRGDMRLFLHHIVLLMRRH
jgi:hypothetical protein